jgi:hypothetical protein
VELNRTVITGGKLQTDGAGLIVSAGATLTDVVNEGALHIPNTNGSNSFVRVDGAFLANNGVIIVNPAGAVGGAANLTFNADMTLEGAGSIVLNSTDARLATEGNNKTVTQAAGHTIRGKGVLTGGSFVNRGRLEGVSAAEPLQILGWLGGDGALKDVRIGGGFTQILHILGEQGTTAVVPVEGMYDFARNSSLFVDIGGTTPGSDYDQLSSTGPITLSSTATRLEVSLAGGFFPIPGQSFALLTTTNTLTGSFGTVVLPPLPLGLTWTQTQTSSSYSISVGGALAADFDEDGDVDGDDLTLWRAGYGMGTLHSQGDADGDADVDGADFLVWQRSAGWGVASPVVTGVPEPGAAALVCAAFAAVIGTRRTRPRLQPRQSRAMPTTPQSRPLPLTRLDVRFTLGCAAFRSSTATPAARSAWPHAYFALHVNVDQLDPAGSRPRRRRVDAIGAVVHAAGVSLGSPVRPAD